MGQKEYRGGIFGTIFLLVVSQLLLRLVFLFLLILCYWNLKLRLGFWSGWTLPFFCGREFLLRLGCLISFLFLGGCIRGVGFGFCLRLFRGLALFVRRLVLRLLGLCEELRGLGSLLGKFGRKLR